MVGASAARNFPRRCGRPCSRHRARSWTRPSRIRAPGRSTVTTCSAVSSSIILPTGTGWTRRPPGWRDGREALHRSFHADQASAISSVARACRRNGKTGSRLNETRRCDCATGFEPIPLVWPRRRACVTWRTTRRFRASRPMGSRIAFIATDEGRRPLGLYVADLDACDPRRLARVDSSHAFAWTPDGRSIVFSQHGLVDNARVIADLYRVEIASGAITRLTRSARLAAPDVHPDGRTIVAVQYDNDRSRLVTVDVASSRITATHRVLDGDCLGPGPLVARRHAARGGALHARRLVRSGSPLGRWTAAPVPDRRSRPRRRSGLGRERPCGSPAIVLHVRSHGSSRALRSRARRRWQPSSLSDGAGRDGSSRGGGCPDAA